MEKYINEQEFVVKFLTNSYKKDRLSHSYLFVGEKGTNKLSIAKEFAKFVLCENNCCNECNICRRIDNLSHPNVKVIFPEESTIKKESIVELQSDFSKTSLEKGAKIYIIVDAHLMNDSSSNSLLKFIEEPVGDIYGILLTTNEDAILPTIKSRSQILHFKSKNQEELREYFIEKGFDNTLAEILPVMTNNLDEALLLADSENIKAIITGFLDSIKSLKKNELFLTYSINHNFEKDDLKMYFKLITEFFKDVLYAKIGKEEIRFTNELNLINELKEKYSADSLVKIIDVLIDAQNRLSSRLNEGLLVDSTLLKIEEVLNESY